MNLQMLAAPIFGSLVTVLALSAPGFSAAQSPFVRADAFDFRGVHASFIGAPGGSGGGTWTPDYFEVGIKSDTDFHKFKLRVRTGMRMVDWTVNHVKVDMNNDGTWELETSAPEAIASYTYPEPAGLSAQYTVLFQIEFINPGGRREVRQRESTITIFPAPRVFVTAENDAFIQLRNEDPTNKIPILVVEGFDPLNDKFPEWYYVLVQEFVNDDVYPAGFEVFFLNFNEGGADLRDNASVVASALEKIHEICPNSEIALFGLSMGGPISRYALAKAEHDGDAHHVGLFLSFDSPQQKAHTSPGLQDWIAGEDPNEGAIGHLQATLNSVAAKQMLGYNTYDPEHVFFYGFYNALNALNGDGYPHHSFNAAISNGNFEAKWRYESVGRHMMTLKINDQLIKDVPAVELDCGAGGLMSNLTTRRYGDIFNIPFLHIWYDLEIIFNPVYIPTYSALDLQGYHVNPQTGDIDIAGNSKFDDFVVQSTSLMHHELSQASRSKIMDWLDRTSNLNVNYALQEGGTATPETFPVTILHNTPITILPKNVTVNGASVTYNFANWDDGDIRNPRNFYASHDATRTVRLKGHRVTTSSGAEWASNERRIAVDFDWVGPTYHAVYESGGTIWYLRNRRNAGWEPERVISTGTEAASNPTITTHSWGHEDQIQVYVAWIDDGYVWFRASNADNGLTWKDVKAIPAGMASSVILPDPYASIWAEGTPGYEGIYYYKMPETNDTGEPHRIPGTEGISSSPAACATGGCRYDLAFIRSGSVYVEGFSDPDLLNGWVPPTVCSPAVDLTSPGWTPSNPTIVNNDGVICVAWEERYGATRRIAYRERSGGAWSPTSYFTHSNHLVAKPALAIDGECGRVNLLWECGGSIARVTRPRIGTVWEGVAHIGNGRAPSIVESSSQRAVPMWVSGASAPYSIELAGSLACNSPGGGGGGGCPVLQVFKNGQWQDRNSVLGKSAYAAEAIVDDDWYWVQETVGAATSPTIQFRIKEATEGERTTLDFAEFWVVDHPTSTNVWTTQKGKRIQSTAVRLPTIARMKDGPSLLEELEAVGDDNTFGVGGGDSLVVVFSDTTETPSDAAVVIYGKGKPHLYTWAQVDEYPRGIRIEPTYTIGAGDFVMPRKLFSPAVIDSPKVHRGDGIPDTLKLAIGEYHELDQIALLEHVEPWSGIVVKPLSTATHSANGNVTTAVSAVGGTSTTIDYGQYVTLSFAYPALAAGNTREMIVRLRGSYARTSQALTDPPVELEPWVWGIRQIVPNPSAGSVVVYVNRQGGARHRLSLYDVGGRLVRTLSEGNGEHGTQAVSWDGRDDQGHRVGAGVYFARLVEGSRTDNKTLVLLR